MSRNIRNALRPLNKLFRAKSGGRQPTDSFYVDGFAFCDSIHKSTHKRKDQMSFGNSANNYFTVVFDSMSSYMKWLCLETCLKLDMYLAIQTSDTEHVSWSVGPIIEMHSNIGFRKLLAVYNSCNTSSALQYGWTLGKFPDIPKRDYPW